MNIKWDSHNLAVIVAQLLLLCDKYLQQSHASLEARGPFGVSLARCYGSPVSMLTSTNRLRYVMLSAGELLSTQNSFFKYYTGTDLGQSGYRLARSGEKGGVLLS